MDNDITYFGHVNYRGREDRFGIKRDDRRRHMYVIGKTGMGKTALLQNMVVQNIKSGEGVGIIDPHGEFAETLLDYVPKERINDVVYFNPADGDYPVGLNLLEDIGYDKRHLVASGLMGVFKKIWIDVWSARMEYILNNTILALLEYPDATLLDVNRMLSNKNFRRNVLEHVKDPIVKSFWVDEFGHYTERLASEATAAIQNKVGQFTAAPLIRNIIGQKDSTIDLREIMDGKKIFIINLSKGRIGEDNSRLLGAMVITKIYLAAMSRIDVPESKRVDFALYVDEFQNFASEAFESILSESRKYRLSLVLAHQYIEQMDETVRDAVFGNIGTLISFRVGAIDAEYLEKECEPVFLREDLVNLSKYRIILKLMIDGVSSQAFSATTMPPILRPPISFRSEIIEHSRQLYSTPREKIEKIIHLWAGVKEEGKEAAVGNLSGKPKQGSAAKRADEELTRLYDAVCDECGKETKIVFEPDGSRPVFCKKCRRKHERERGAKKKGTARNETPISLKNAVDKFPPPKNQPQRFQDTSGKPNASGNVPALSVNKKHKKDVDVEGLRDLLKDVPGGSLPGNNKR